MMAYDADGAVAIVRSVAMMMVCRYERGDQEKQYEKNGEASVPDHDAPFQRCV